MNPNARRGKKERRNQLNWNDNPFEGAHGQHSFVSRLDMQSKEVEDGAMAEETGAMDDIASVSEVQRECGSSSGGCKSPTRSASDAGELTCAVCLGDIPLADMAMIKGCDHIYCAFCILRWSLHRESPWCPQCKQPFTILLTYRDLEGSLHDFPHEESVVLLKRARWFQESMRKSPHESALLDEALLADETAWQDYADDYDFEDDDAIEEFYFSSAAGRARVILGNRRFGEGGFISGGRRQARPIRSRGSSSGKGKAKSSKKDLSGLTGSFAVTDQSAGVSSASGSASGSSGHRSLSKSIPKTPAIPTPNAHGGQHASSRRSSSPVAVASPSPQWYEDSDWGGRRKSAGSPSGSIVLGSSPSGSGRRARRNARRAAEDAAAMRVGSAGTSTECFPNTEPTTLETDDARRSVPLPVQSS